MEENWLKSHWRPVAAVVYLIICVFDFMVMPVVYANNMDYKNVFQEINRLENEKAQVALIQKIDFHRQSWQPITLMGGGMFHLAFGAILTGAAVTRGLEKKSFVERSPHK